MTLVKLRSIYLGDKDYVVRQVCLDVGMNLIPRFVFNVLGVVRSRAKSDQIFLTQGPVI